MTRFLEPFSPPMELVSLLTPSRPLRWISRLSLAALAAILLTACGVVPPNNYAGLSTDGKMLLVSNNSFVFSVSPNTGTIDWKFPSKPDQYIHFYGAPAEADGWVYAGSYNNVAYGFSVETINKTETIPTWTYKEYEGKGRFIGAPAVAGDLVLFPSTDSHLYAIDRKAGTVRWRFETGGALWAPTATDGKLAFQAGLDHFLYAFDLARGSLAWKVDLGGPVIGGSTMDAATGLMYIGTLNSEVIAVKAEDGQVVWRKPLKGKVWSAPLLHDGKLYLGTDLKKAYILDASDGKELSSLDAAGSLLAAPVYTDNAVVFTTEDGEIFALSLDGQNRPWTRTIKGKLYTTPVVVNNQVILAPFQGDTILAGYDFSGNLDEKWSSVKPN